MPTSADLEVSGLDHVVLSGGTPAEWLDMTTQLWASRLHDLAKGAEIEGAHWITLLPHHGDEFSDSHREQFWNLMLSVGGVTEVSDSLTPRLVWNSPSGSHVIIDPTADGHKRFAATVEAMRGAGVAPELLTEEMLSSALLRPAETEADLVLILGSPDRIPDSMVWELAYSELVFIDINWEQLNASHLELAIDDFNRRHRRFGGLDS